MDEGFYRTLAARLVEKAGDSGFFNGSVESDTGTLQCTLVRGTTGGHGDGTLAGWVPVWWEFATGDEVLEDNDFSWREMCEYAN